jgi:hypothetical protein
MAVETLGEAYELGWRVTARCARGKQDGMSRPADRNMRRSTIPEDIAIKPDSDVF